MKKPAHPEKCAGFDLVPERGIEPPTLSLRMMRRLYLPLLMNVYILYENQRLIGVALDG